MRQNERQERPRPPQERAVKSSIRDIPPAPLSSSTSTTSKDAKALSGTCSAKAGPESAGQTILKQ